MGRILCRIKMVSMAILLFNGAIFGGHLTDQLLISAKLTGDQEVPAVATDAVGVASFMLNRTWDTLFVNISVNGLSGDIKGIHVHQGLVGVNGPVVTDLMPYVKGNRAVTFLTGGDLTPAMLSEYLSGNYYLNVHTDANPGGEIRGQLTLETDWGFRANLDTMQQTTPVSNDAWGVGLFNVSKDLSTLQVRVVANGLSGEITGAHLHFGALGQNGNVGLDLSPYISGNTIVGDIDISTMPELVGLMMDGGVYVNLHTNNNPNGEIRGQIWLDNKITFDAWLNTMQQVVAPVGAAGFGAAYFSINTTLDTLWYEIQADGLTGEISGAHLHDGGIGQDGPVLIDLSSNINGSRISGMVAGGSITSSLISKLLTGNIYINIHTFNNPDGEIRGQVYRLAREGYSFSMDGFQEVPSNFSFSTGAGLVSIDRDQSNAHFMMVVSGLSAPLIGAHFHNAPMGSNGDVIYHLTSFFSQNSTEDAAFGYWTANDAMPFTTVNSALFRNNNVYVNIHTPAKPGGEIRGQVLRGAVAFNHNQIDNGSLPSDPNFTNGLLFSSRFNGAQMVPPVTTNATGVGGFLLSPDRDTLWVNINVDGLSGPITAAHIHEAVAGSNGDVLYDLSDMVTDKKISGFLTGIGLNKFITGQLYVNVHTDENPDGEIRGQILFESFTPFILDLDGNQQVPALSTSAIGKGLCNLSKDESRLEIKLVATGLSGPIKAAHLHMGAAGTNGDVVEDLTPFINGNTIVADVLPASYLAELKLGNIYINLHTDANPGGEIRSQLNVARSFAFDTWMNGAQQVPEADVPGAGVGVFWFNATWDTLYYDVLADMLSGTIEGIHIHAGGLGNNGNVLVSMTENIDGNRVKGNITGGQLTNELISQLIMGDTYVNIHTASLPDGEIRGQIYRLAADGYSFDACAGQEVPPTTAIGYGGGILAIDRNQAVGHLMFTSTNLTGDLTGAHFHKNTPGNNGPVVYDLTDLFNGSSVFSYLPIDSQFASDVKSGTIYLNVHTSENPGGEIRGQIDNIADCGDPTSATHEVESVEETIAFPNPVLNQFFVKYDGQTSALLTVKDAFGNFVHTQVISGSNDLVQVNSEHMKPGLYLVEISSDKRIIVQKIMKL